MENAFQLNRRIAFITFDFAGNTGGYAVNQRLLQALNDSFEVDLIYFEGKSIFTSLREYKRIFALITKRKYQFIVLGSSLLGLLSLLKYRNTRIIVQFHNNEVDYYRAQYGDGLKNILRIVIVGIFEMIARRTSGGGLFLTHQDAEGYLGRSFVYPIGFKKDPDYIFPIPNFGEAPRLLFVGSSIPANIDAIEWIKDNEDVLLRCCESITIVGRGIKPMGWVSDKINVIGEVKELEDYYKACHIVISPVFYGAGMKTKVAESLYHNRPIVASHHSAIGLSYGCDDFVYLAEDAETFNRRIHEIANKISAGHYKTEMYDYYMRFMSYETYREQLKEFLKHEV